MAGNQPAIPTRGAKRDSQRSRKGCPECRSRKIKCDEQKPECGQCLKTGRACTIIDSLFKPHSYSFLAAPAQGAPPTCAREILPAGMGLDHTSQHTEKDVPHSPVQTAPELRSPVTFPHQDHSISSRRASDALSKSSNERGADYPTPRVTQPVAVNSRPQNDSYSALSRSPEASARPYNVHIQSEESYQDRCEIAFFLRHFAEGPGQWMDICGGQSYFSQHIVQLAHWSPLVRYAACALGAKQLGQTRHPETQIRQTNAQKLMLKALIDSRLGFTWYGAKYYEKAIQLLAKQISHKDRPSASLSPNYIYGSGFTPQSGDYEVPRCPDEEAAPFQILAACILCQYEDVNATLRAWSGHLDGIYRLLRPHLPDLVAFRMSDHIPQPARASDAAFWFFVVHDMFNAFVTRQRTRINTEDFVLWRKMGLPLNNQGYLAAHDIGADQPNVILFKALARMMCQLVNADLSDVVQWTRLKEDFDRWQNTVPSSFYIPIAWPPVAEPRTAQHMDPFSREIWFASDISAITLAFYHMSRMILLISRPMDVFLRQSQSRDDLLATYNTLQQELRRHAMEIIPVMHAMPNETVQKYMLQPLYVAGRCLIDEKERKSLLQILRDMADDFGLFTDDRIKDLCDEWGMPCDGIDRKDGHGILT
ncbi:Zn(II)2Cys6 transcription factor [Aspergillus lucknowensis]|uniref:Zn(2)-C6 fungal-type domain-containing protein n=1 Tax=Aspergillus lucknowensis TaxID=176173 RepID=A0ABR4LSY7_9EURO